MISFLWMWGQGYNKSLAVTEWRCWVRSLVDSSFSISFVPSRYLVLSVRLGQRGFEVGGFYQQPQGWNGFVDYFSWLFDLSLSLYNFRKLWKMLLSFSEPNVMSPFCLFCPTNSLNPKRHNAGPFRSVILSPRMDSCVVFPDLLW